MGKWERKRKKTLPQNIRLSHDEDHSGEISEEMHFPGIKTAYVQKAGDNRIFMN